MRQSNDFPSREATIKAVQELVPHCSMQMSDGAVLFAVKVPWQLAGAIIKHLNTENIRRMDHRWAGDMAQDMSTERWSPCYDPISFTTSWVLHNGQHRLFASWKSQRDQYWIFVISGNPDMRKSTDGGKKRTIAQTHGLPNSVASVVNFVMLLEARSKVNGITRAAKLQRYLKDSGTFEHYSGYFLRYQLLRESHVAASFSFAEIYRPLESERIRRLAEDLAEASGRCHVNELIGRLLSERRRLGVAAHSAAVRYDESCRILRGIQAHLIGADIARLEPHPGTLNWFDPVSSLKTAV